MPPTLQLHQRPCCCGEELVRPSQDLDLCALRLGNFCQDLFGLSGLYIRSALPLQFGHVHPATVATVSPSGYYVASADVTGLVKVWDLVGEDHVTKLETRALTGRTNDLCWDGESKRLIAAGEGKERYGHGFTSDSGNSTGEIGGHSKPINAVAIRHQRPFRAVTASDDYTLVFHTGVPWKFNKVIRTHSAFVQALAYSPTGDHFVSAGSDRKIFLYDGKEGDVLTPDGLTGHQGTVYAVAFNKSGDQIMSASADGTVKLWSVPDGKELASWTVPGQQQQVGGCFLGNGNFVAVSLTGDLSVIDPTSKDGKPVRSYYVSLILFALSSIRMTLS